MDGEVRKEELLEAQIADYNRKNAWDITVSARAFQDWASLYEAVNQNIDSQSLPELVVALPEYALDWDEQGDIVDLTDYVTHQMWGMSE